MVIFLSSSEIEWIRKHRETVSSPQTDALGTSEEISFWSYLELKLANTVDPSILGEALQNERNRQAPMIGHSRTKHKHYPVKLLDDRILDLAVRGLTIKAVVLARIRYNYSLTEAKKFVEELMEN